ncbi:MAG: methyltransferase domain-containing protein [Gammaproteobacteria bacterium]|nr:methyltransferase domain-containing protein [Gammaproteobacteria bacterium]
MFYTPAFNNRCVLPPASWDELAQGKWLLDQVNVGLSQWWPRIFGYHLLKVGSLSHQIDTSACSIGRQFSVSPTLGTDVVADISRLPFQESSIDACLLSLSLNFHHNPHQVLREVNRVTVAGGHIIIIGLNPFSPLGLVHLNPQLGHKYPFNGRFYSVGRVHDWLGLLGYKVIAEQKLIYSSLLMKPHRTHYLQQVMQHNLPSFGSFYMIMAKKLVRPLTPVKPRWQLNSKPSLTPIATMQNGNTKTIDDFINISGNNK